MTDTRDSMKFENAARRRLNDFERKYGKEALHLAYHVALPVALNADLLHLLRINFFLDPPESLLYTAEVDLLFAPFCHEIGEGLYEIDAETRDLLLWGLVEEYGRERIREVATLLFQYNESASPWASRTGLQRAQQLTVLNALAPSKAKQWLTEAETWVGQGSSVEREWFVAMSKEIERGRETVSFASEERQEERAVPIPAILIAGPPNAGKSVLAYGLTQALRGRGVLHHLLRVSPDGEGNWMQEADQETTRLFRVKGSWTETFIEGICRDIERRPYPFIVDPGGMLGEAQLPILRRCTHALLLLRADVEASTQSWPDIVEQEGLLPIAQIYSARKGASSITSLEPLIQGTLVGLERNKLVQGPLFDALVDRITSLFASRSPDVLTKGTMDAAVVESVIDLNALLQTRFPQSERWEPEMLVDLLTELPTGKSLAVYGVGPSWLYAAIALHVHPQQFYLFDPRIGWVSPPALQISLQATAEIRVQVRADEQFTTLRVDIPELYLDYSQSERLPFPPIQSGRGLIVYGKIPHWLLTAIVRLYYKAEVGWIAYYSPQQGGAVIVASRMSDHVPGELIPLSSSHLHFDMEKVSEELSEASQKDARQSIGKAGLIRLLPELYWRCRSILLVCSEFQSDENLRSVFVTGGLEEYLNLLPEARSAAERIDHCLALLLERQWNGEHGLLLFLEALRNRYQQSDELKATLDELGRDVRSALEDRSTNQDMSVPGHGREALPGLESQRAPFVPESLHHLGFVGQTIKGYDVIIPPIVAVPAGPFLMGSDKQSDPLVSEDEQPLHHVTLAAYQIGRYPLTVAEYACAVRARVVNEPSQKSSPGSNRDWKAQLSQMDHPVINVSLPDFVSYAQWLADLTGIPWRLPTEAEWEKAARGNRGYIYPWGDLWNQSLANTSETGQGTTTPVGAYPGGASLYGALDMVGNVWEITATVWGFSYPYRPNDGRNDVAAQTEHVLRGGAWYLPSRFARAACRYTTRRPMDTFGTRLARG